MDWRSNWQRERRTAKRASRQRKSLTALRRQLGFEQLESRQLLAADFGDAPAPYPTLLADDGARHITDNSSTTLYLGAGVDSEVDGSPSITANGDDLFSTPGVDDENGVFDPDRDLVFTVGTTPTVHVYATNKTGQDAMLYGWIDINQDGGFDNATERASLIVPSSDSASLLALQFPPLSATAPFGESYVRLRISTDFTASNPHGEASDGEVEDYRVSVLRISELETGFAGYEKLVFGQSGVPLPENAQYFGASIAALGDVDGDAVPDMAVGHTNYVNGGTAYGAVQVLLLNPSGTVRESTTVTIGTPNGPTLSASDNFGSAIVSLGDLDGDGISELAVGASGDDVGSTDAGAVHILFMDQSGVLKRSQKIASEVGGGPSLHSGERFGSSLAAIGDLDGNGVIDLAVGAAQHGEGDAKTGGFYILFMAADGTVTSYTEIYSESDGGPDLTNGGRFGSSIASLGDIDGDGFREIAVSADLEDTIAPWQGNVYLISLNTDGTVRQSRALVRDGSEGFPSQPNGPSGRLGRLGSSLAAPGDLDGDGVQDLLIGDSYYLGAVYVAYLQTTGEIRELIRVSSGFPGGPVFDSGGSLSHQFGSAVSLLGDLDKDGAPEFAVGATADDTAGLADGAVYVISLRPDEHPPTLTSIRRLEGSRNPTAADSLWFRVEFSEDVTGVDVSDFTASGGLLAVATNVIQVSPRLFDVELGRGNLAGYNGEAGLELAMNALITDRSGNALPIIEPSIDETFLVVNYTSADFGDAPAPFPTVFNEGAWHFESSMDEPRLGMLRDSEQDGVQSLLADGDGEDEDGVTFGTIRVGQLAAAITVNVQSAAGKLDAWIDFNGNGSWADPGERIFTSKEVALGDNTLYFDVPVSAVSGITFARFRLSTAGGLGFAGPATDGEVEDYAIEIQPPNVGSEFAPYQDFSNDESFLPSSTPIDLDNDGDLDFLTTKQLASNQYVVVWYELTSDRSYVEHAVTQSSSEISLLLPTDIDFDGDYDLIISVSNEPEYKVLSNVAGEFVENIWFSPEDELRYLSPNDVDQDGDMDVVGFESVTNSLVWYEFAPDSDPAKHTIDDSVGGPTSLSAADIDGDGDLDLLASIWSGRIVWYENDGQQQFQSHSIGNHYSAYYVHSVDIDNDGDMDVLASALYKDSSGNFDNLLVWYENVGEQQFVATTIYAREGYYRTLYVPADIDGDGDFDIVAWIPSGRSTNRALVWYRNDGNQGFRQITIEDRAASAWPIVADLDSDGDLDIAFAGAEYNRFGWYENVYSVHATFEQNSLQESNGSVQMFRFEIESERNQPSTISFELSGSALHGTDYFISGHSQLVGSVGSVVIPPGQTFAVVTVNLIDDELPELDEVIRLAAVAGEGYRLQGEVTAEWTVISEELGGEYGDAPLMYPTLAGDNGAAHSQGGPDSPRLGASLDLDSDGHPSPTADGDGADDDGVTFDSIRVGQLTNSVTVNVQNGSGFVDAWVDWNGDGHWGSLDQILDSQPVVVGDNEFTFPVPLTAKSGTTYARFRVSSTGGLGVTGVAADGEVEDYQVEIRPPAETTGVFDSNTKIAELTNSSLPSVMQTVDLDTDGDLDIIGTNHSGYLWWFEHTGEADFIPHELSLEGSSIELADLDRDGDIDLVTTYNSTVAWLENDGLASFTIHRLTTSLSGAIAAAIVDLNGDGRLDIAATGTYGDILWFENLGYGEFSQSVVGDVGGTTNPQPKDLVATDVDLDGKDDLVLTGSTTFADTFWFRNNGDGTFSERLLNSYKARALAVSDFNGDGLDDLLLSSTGELRILLADGDSNYTSLVLDDTNNARQSLVVVDFDGDGDIDVAEAFNNSSQPLVWYQNDGFSNFTRRVIATPSTNVSSIVAGDIDANGTIDLVAASRYPYGLWSYTQPLTIGYELVSPALVEEGSEPLIVRLSVSSAVNHPLSIPFQITGTATADDYVVQGADRWDGVLGVVTIPAGSSYVDLMLQPFADSLDEVAETVVIGTAIGAILNSTAIADYGDAPIPYPVGPLVNGPAHIAVGPMLGVTRSIDTYGSHTAAAAGDSGDDGVVFDIVQVGNLISTVTVTVSNAPAGARLDAWIDFNGDGSWSGLQEQIFTSHPVVEGENVLLFETPAWALSGATHARFRLSSEGGLGVAGAAADGEVEDYELVISPPGAGPGHFNEVVLLETGNSLFDLVPIDFDRDGDLDFVAVDYAGQLIWFENPGAQSNDLWKQHILASDMGSVRDLKVLDFDRDGDLDVLYVNSTVWVGALLNDGENNFTYQLLYTSDRNMLELEPMDFDSDGDIDIVLRESQSPTTTISLLENSDNLTFVRKQLASEPIAISEFDVVDINQDGYLDVLVGGGGGFFPPRIEYIAIWMNDSTGGFTRTLLSNTDSHFSVVDLDRDGDLDVMAARSGSSGSLHWHEQQDTGFVEHDLALGFYRAYSVAAYDFDGDGDLDPVYGASASSLFENKLTGDFNNDGAVDLQDYDIWKAEFGHSSESELLADANRDGAVNLADYTLWRDNLGGTTPSFIPRYINGYFPTLLFAGDIDNDGDLDILTSKDSSIVAYLNVPQVTMTTSGDTLAEQDGMASLVFTRDGDLNEDLTVQLRLDGIAVAGVDYLLDGAQLTSSSTALVTIPAGERSLTIQVTAIDDTLAELDEPFTITMSAGHYMVSSPSKLDFILVSNEMGGDFGDAPDTYSTSSAKDGPRHSRVTENDPRLGATRADEDDATPSDDASSSTSDDGVLLSPVQIGQTDAMATVNVQGADGVLDAWIDFDGNGEFDAVAERVFENVPVTVGDNTLSFDVPETTVMGSTFARFRISSSGVELPAGIAADGEVEDYAVVIAPAPPIAQLASDVVARQTSLRIADLAFASLEIEQSQYSAGTLAASEASMPDEPTKPPEDELLLLLSPAYRRDSAPGYTRSLPIADEEHNSTARSEVLASVRHRWSWRMQLDSN
ncbi:FG-GAP-like repeat-containing protein [Aeoliella mucimassa]|uniref:FG-GAP repeat protein n=1 Tax=Aeoliella mucimassa TaxID=2527972 RepID=A0A518APN2_9BACT|nr:FG-GAP-like repeat-containing protein [Aeoliella mucimassa]QDU56689.1 FG-GAP repeat protein [Aeoliella mucimassa]